MKKLWNKVRRWLRWLLILGLGAIAVDSKEKPGSRAVAAILLLGYYVHLQLAKVRERQDEIAAKMHALVGSGVDRAQ